jgi:hypothetical protein
MKYLKPLIFLCLIQFGCVNNSNSQHSFPPLPEYRISKAVLEERIPMADSIHAGLQFVSKTDQTEKSSLRILQFTIYVSEGSDSLIKSNSERYFNETSETIKQSILNIDEYDILEIIFTNKEGIIYKETTEIEN